MGDGPPADDEITQILAGALPLSMHPSPRTVANIGIGSGLTSQVLLTTDAVQSLTSIEIEPFIVEAARLAYLPRVSRLFEDPRSRIVIDDAKTFFAGAGTRFDVIVSEPSNPWVSGVATLFSDEFYRQIVNYLAPDGMLVQWLQIYETDLSVVISILKALSPHFHDYHVYNVDDTNILVIAQRGKTVPDPDPAILASPDLQRELRLGGIVGVEDLISRRIGNKALLEPFVSSYPVPVNSDYFPYVDQNAVRFRFMDRDAFQLPKLTMLPVPFLQLAVPEWQARSLEQAADFAQGRRETLSNRAGLITASIAENNFSLLPGEIVQSISTLDMPAESCRSGGRGDGVGSGGHRPEQPNHGNAAIRGTGAAVVAGSSHSPCYAARQQLRVCGRTFSMPWPSATAPGLPSWDATCSRGPAATQRDSDTFLPQLLRRSMAPAIAGKHRSSSESGGRDCRAEANTTLRLEYSQPRITILHLQPSRQRIAWIDPASWRTRAHWSSTTSPTSGSC